MENITNLGYRSDPTYGVAGPIAGANKLWLSVFSGETLAAYDQANIFEQLVDHKVLSGGVAWEFPVTGTVSILAAWNAGVELGGGSSTSNTSSTIAVKLDKRPIAAHFEIDNIDLMQTQWEFRAELARQAGLSLANARDKQIAAYIGRAASEAPLANDPRGIIAAPVFPSIIFKNLGATINTAATGAMRSAAALEALKAAEDFVVWLQTINAPTDGVYLAVTPRAFQDIRALGVARSSDASTVAANMQPMFGGSAEAGGLGLGLKMGLNNLSDTLDYMGVKIIKSNHLPLVDYSASAPLNIGETRYNLNFEATGCVGLLFQKSAVASLKLQGLKMDTVDDVRRNTTFTVASAMNGTGVLRPECAAMLCGEPVSLTGNYSGSKMFTAADTLNTTVDAANVGGTESATARGYLRTALGANFSAEFVVTTAGAFPYLNA